VAAEKGPGCAFLAAEGAQQLEGEGVGNIGRVEEGDIFLCVFRLAGFVMRKRLEGL
jgi:hypothetical protein